jgi:pyruvate dehydrogenase E2 component (dihydrolipoamide acetyltransferase)
MATVIVMPRLSPTMEEGVLLKWTKKEGDKINPGDVIAEVETDKANMDFPLEDEGTLLKLLVAEGDTVKLGSPVAVLGEPGEDAAAAIAANGSAAAPAVKEVAAPPAKAPAPPAKAPRTPGPSETQPARPSVMAAVPRPQTAPPAAPAPSAPSGSRIRSSPLARKIARERGVDITRIDGTGPHGRVILRDIEQAAATQPAVAPSRIRPQPLEHDETIPLSPMRKTIARRLVEAKQSVPHFYVTMDADVAALVDFHAGLKAASDIKVSLNDLIVKALALALVRVPAANASFTDAGIVRYAHVDVGIAVSIEDGLVTPVLRDAAQKSIGTIALEAADLITRARARKLTAGEFSGGTFSVSNMGMYGVTSFSAIINPPEGGILAVGAVQKRAVVVTDEDGEESLAIGKRMTLTLSCDHRVIDGALGAELLREVVRILEKPHVMAL